MEKYKCEGCGSENGHSVYHSNNDIGYSVAGVGWFVACYCVNCLNACRFGYQFGYRDGSRTIVKEPEEKIDFEKEAEITKEVDRMLENED